jgi:mycothiol synthase
MTSINSNLDGVSVRRATPEDAAAIKQILDSEIFAVDPTHGSFGIGIANEIIDSSGDPSPTWLFFDEGANEAFGFGNLHPDLTAKTLDPSIAVVAGDIRFPLLLDWFISTAQREYPDFIFHLEVHANHLDKLAHLASRGFEAIRYYHTLRASVSANLKPPELPDGVELSVVDLNSHQELADWHSVQQNSFAENFGFVARDFESWSKRIAANKNIPTDGVHLLRLEGKAVGFIWLDDIDAAESRGFVVNLGVVKDYRANGFGRLLLENALAQFSRRGYSHAALGVDTENSSGALGLYEKMGFKVMSTYIELSKTA